MTRGTRLFLIILPVTLVLLGVAAMVALHVLLQPRRVTDILRNQAREAGLQLTLSAPAEPALWPRPSLVLHGLTLSADNRPVLVAARGRLVVPWRTLFGGQAAITRLDLLAPQINLAQLEPVLASMHFNGGSSSPVLLQIRNGIRIRNGSLVRGTETLLDNIQLDTGALVPGQRFELKLKARTADERAFNLELHLLPEQSRDGLNLRNIRLAVHLAPALRLNLDGKLAWLAGSKVRMDLAGTLAHGDDRKYSLALQLQPAHVDSPLQLGVTLHGQAVDARFDLPPAQLSDWWKRIAQSDGRSGLPLPPVHGRLQASQLQLGTLRIKGLEIRSDAPAHAGSTPAPATSNARP